MKNIREWLLAIAIFIVLILPGVTVLWKAIIFNILPDIGVVLVCIFMFVFGCIAILVLSDYLLGKHVQSTNDQQK